MAKRNKHVSIGSSLNKMESTVNKLKNNMSPPQLIMIIFSL